MTEDISPEEKLLKVIQDPGVSDDSGQKTGDPSTPGGSRLRSETTPGQADAASSGSADAKAMAGKPSDAVSSEQSAVSSEKESAPGVADETKAGETPQTTDQKPADAEAMADKPKLKMKSASAEATEDKPEEKAEIKVGPASIGKGLEVPETGGAKIGAGGIVLDDKKKSSARLGVRTVNKFLMAAAIIVLCFIAWEAASYQLSYPVVEEIALITDVSGAEQPADIQDMTTSEEGLVDLSKVLSVFQKKPIVLFPEAKVVTTTVAGPVVKAPQADWMKYAKAHYNMKGRSRLSDGSFEALVADKKLGKLYFLKVDDKVQIEEQEIVVKEVAGKYVKLELDGAELTIE